MELTKELNKDFPCIKKACLLFPCCKQKRDIYCGDLFRYILLRESRRVKAFKIFPLANAIHK
jgi:hypothetical protein